MPGLNVGGKEYTIWKARPECGGNEYDTSKSRPEGGEVYETSMILGKGLRLERKSMTPRIPSLNTKKTSTNTREASSKLESKVSLKIDDARQTYIQRAVVNKRMGKNVALP